MSQLISRATPQNLSLIWNQVRYALLHNMPPTASITADSIHRVLMRLITGEAQCWIIHTDPDPEKDRMIGFAITMAQWDPVSRTKKILVWALHAFENFEDATWERMFKALFDFGRQQGATGWLAFTNNEAVLRRVKAVGASAQWTVVEGELL